ncbi:MAG: hypothetical protein KF832_11275 [Caldilineaceae bacterium]|nr:hypothetical protein [Caldilineaceae bacterium]
MKSEQALTTDFVWPKRIFFAVAFCALASLLTLILSRFPITLLLLGIGIVAGAGLWFVLLGSGRDFEILLLGLFLIGYFQGYGAKLLGESIPQSIWGGAKYGLLGLMLLGYVARVLQGTRVKMNIAMRLWLVTWFLFGIVATFLMVEAYLANGNYSPIGTIQQFGIVNMSLAFLVYLRAKPTQIDRWLQLLIWAGIVAACFGIVQRVLGPARLSMLGISSDTLLASMAFLPADNPETGFLDLEKGLRVFSFFDTHHAFSGFLVLSILALQIQKLRNRVKGSFYWPSMALMWAGMTVTFNLTNLLTCLLTLSMLTILQHGGRFVSLLRIASSKRFWQIGIALFFILLITVVAYSPLRNRLVGIFDVRQGSSTAGGSFAYRLEGLVSGIHAIIDYPLGFGLYLNSTYGGQTNPELNHYARVDGYFTSRGVFFSGDNWFQWLMVQIGLPGFILYASLFWIPIGWGWYWRNRLRNRDWRIIAHGCLALLIVVFVAGISNSPILAFPPANLLFWAMVGLLIKAPVWAQNEV